MVINPLANEQLIFNAKNWNIKLDTLLINTQLFTILINLLLEIIALQKGIISLLQTMNKGKTIFTQVMSLINRYEFKKCVNRYKGDRHAFKFTCRDQFMVMVFTQFTNYYSSKA